MVGLWDLTTQELCSEDLQVDLAFQAEVQGELEELVPWI